MKHISLAVKSINRFGLKNKNIVYEWDQSANQKTKKHYTESELAAKQTIRHKNRLKEDYRIHLFDLKKQKAEVKPPEDEIFGFELPEMKKFGMATLYEIYRSEKARDGDEFITTKLAYLPEFVSPYGNIDGKVEEKIAEIKKLILNIENNHMNIYDEYLLREKIFETEELKAAMNDLKELVVGLNFKYLPSFVSKLCFELKYNDNYVKGLNLYAFLEEKIKNHIHLYSIDDLARIYFGLTYKMPKRCSIDLRQTIREKIVEQNFNVLEPEQVLRIYTAFKNEFNCQKVHLKCIEYFFDQYNKIENVSKNDPNFPIKLLYTYMNSRPTEKHRRFLLEENEIENETDKITDMYMPLVLDNIQSLNKNDFLRLLSTTYTLKLNDYEDLYLELENYFLEHIKEFNNNEKTLVLFYMMKCNNNRGICSRDFWKTITEQHLGSTIPINNLQINAFCRLVYALTTSKSIDAKKFEKLFGQHLLSFLNSEELNYNEASLLSAVLVILDSPEAKLDKYFKSFIKNISMKQEWVPLRYYYHLKFFAIYCSLVYPEWNISYIENLFYHAEKKFNTFNNRKNHITPDYKDLSSVMSRLDTYLLSFMDYKNLFLIDYCIEERKLAVIYLTDRDYIYDLMGGQKILNPLTEIKLKLLEKDDYVVCSIDHEEFMAIDANKSDWLKSKLEAAYRLTEERARELHIAHQKAVYNRDFEKAKSFFKDSRYIDLKLKHDILGEKQEAGLKEIEDLNK